MPRKSRDTDYKVNDSVYAKWPGSSMWYKATVVGCSGDHATVKFPDGTVEDLVKDSRHITVSSY